MLGVVVVVVVVVCVCVKCVAGWRGVSMKYGMAG